MGCRLLRESQYNRQPWRNGGGVTAEIRREPMTDGEFLWRLSMADVASDGPFSKFPGYDRHIMLIEGAGMMLEHENLPTRSLERPFDPHSFPGDVHTECRLIEGPCRDLNLMIRRRHASGGFTVARMPAGGHIVANRNVATAIFVLSGQVQPVPGGDELPVTSGDTILPGDGEVDIRAATECALALAIVRRLD